MNASHTFQPGTLIHARGRDWVVLPESNGPNLVLRGLGAAEDAKVHIYLPLEEKYATLPRPAVFPLPKGDRYGTQGDGLLLRDALLLKLRSGAGPFRGFGRISIEPRPYQMAPLLMALKHPVIRLLIADDVGVGKTIEACLIAREMFDRGEIYRLTVLCPPHLCDQWQRELRLRFNIHAEIVKAGTISRLDRTVLDTQSLFESYPFTIVSLDFIKSDKRRSDFILHCPEMVIIDEAHTCVRKGRGRQQRFELLERLAQDPERHLLLLTATPHAGDHEGFYNLLGLLKSEFRQLADLPKDKSREKLRQALRDHFIQRRRRDIRDWREHDLFPERHPRESHYQLTPSYRKLIEQVRAYAGELLAGAGVTARPRHNWWAALALLRCISSSPAAAHAALESRADQAFFDSTRLFDNDLDAFETQAFQTTTDAAGEVSESDDTTPLLPPPVDPSRLAAFAKLATSLLGPRHDPKLALLIAEIKILLDDDYRPVIFCRYLKTAEYLREHLAKAFPDLDVLAVTGIIPADHREQIIAEMDPTRALLVATDCLSEGINLQATFNAVIHYDLAWNPNRHEQRIGRVDRFGQRSPTVRSLMIYGRDNPIDGVVLDVILRKADQINEALGVMVPIPCDEQAVANAIMKSVLMKGHLFEQQPSFDFMGELDMDEAALRQKWDEATAAVDSGQSGVFSQQRIKYEDVWPEWEKAVNVLGGEQDTLRFFRNAAKSLGAPLSPVDAARGLYTYRPQDLKGRLAERLRLQGLDKMRKLSFSLPVPKDFHYIHRAHPLCHLLADHLAEHALNDHPEGLARCGAVFSDQVQTLTHIFLLRLRHQLIQTTRGRRKETLTEEALLVIHDGDTRVLDRDLAGKLMESPATKTMLGGAQKRAFKYALTLAESEALQTAFGEISAQRAEQLREDHQRVRRSFDRAGVVEVVSHQPDIVGIYVLRPSLG